MPFRGEQDYREGDVVRFPDTDMARQNMTEILKRGLGESKEIGRSEKAERRYLRGSSPRRRQRT